MTHLTLYARRNPPMDSNYAPKNAHGVTIYKDTECTRPVTCFDWHNKKPDRRNKWQMFNCAKYQLVWLADATNESYPRLMATTRRASYYEVAPNVFNTSPDTQCGGYYNLQALMKLKGDYVFADYGRESAQ